MDKYRILRTSLCIYEGLRLIFVLGAFILLQPRSEAAFPWLGVITPGALFLLITVFWQVNISAYRLYGPLYLAGKGLGIVSTMFWLFFARNDIMREFMFNEAALIFAPGIIAFFMLGDALSAWLAATLMKS